MPQTQSIATTQRAEASNLVLSTGKTATVSVASPTSQSVAVTSSHGAQRLVIESQTGKPLKAQQYQAQLTYQKVNDENVQTILRLFDKQGSQKLPVDNSVIEQGMRVAKQHIQVISPTFSQKPTERLLNVVDVVGNRLTLTSTDSQGPVELIRNRTTPVINAASSLLIKVDPKSPNQAEITHHNGRKEVARLINPSSINHSLAVSSAASKSSGLAVNVTAVPLQKDLVSIKLPQQTIQAQLLNDTPKPFAKGNYQLLFSPQQNSTMITLRDVNGNQQQATIANKQSHTLVSAMLQQGGAVKISGSALSNILSTQPQYSPKQLQLVAQHPWVTIALDSKHQLVAVVAKNTINTELKLAAGQSAAIQSLRLPSTANSPQTTQGSATTQMPTTTAAATMNTVSNKASNALQEMAKQLIGETRSTSALLKSVHELTTRATQSQTSVAGLGALLTQLEQGLPAGETSDSQRIERLLTAPAINIAPVMQTNPAISSTVQGLAKMVQLALLNRLMSTEGQGLTTQQRDIANRMITGTPQSPLGNTRRAETTNSNEPRTNNASGSINQSATAAASQTGNSQQTSGSASLQQLARLAMGFLAQHHDSKIESAEKRMRGIEQLHYQIPYKQGEQYQHAELVIEREQHQQQTDNGETAQGWKFAMKLNLGDWGDMLAKVKLDQLTLDLMLYCESVKTVEHVKQSLPLLEQQLVSAGLVIAKSQCQQGKIPSSLAKNPHRLFEAFA